MADDSNKNHSIETERNVTMLYQKYEFTVVKRELNPRTMRVERPTMAVEYFQEFADGASQESLFVLIVDGRNNLIGIKEVYRGTATGTSVRIAELLSPVLMNNGVGMVLIHNHPSGDHESSDQDDYLTEEVIKAARLMDIEMLDHLVIGKDGFTSIRSNKPGLWEVPQGYPYPNDVMEG
jgi:DNA repair protein RadC